MPVYKTFKVIIAWWLIVSFWATSSLIPPASAQTLSLPAPGTMIHLSRAFVPAHLLGMTIHPDDPFKFDFLIHKGDAPLSNEQKNIQYTKLIKYFLASLTVPDKDQWVNLSPYEKDRIIADDFGKTEMGRDLLEEDYLLKQITSSLMYPERGLGKSFWERVYKEAWEKFHTTNVPVNTFNKVWIIPDKAIVYESGNTAYIIKSHLKVMLEEDYLSLAKHGGLPGDTFRGRCPQAGYQANQALKLKAPQGNNRSPNDSFHALGSQIIRETILPALEHEVNEGRNFAQLRQIVSGMILATWYKRALKESVLGKVYADKGKIRGLGLGSGRAALNTEKIYQQYLKAFKRGVYSYIKDDEDKYTHQSISRKYFAGGFQRGIVTIVGRAAAAGLKDKISSADFASISKIDRAAVTFQVYMELPAKPGLTKLPAYQHHGIGRFVVPKFPSSARLAPFLPVLKGKMPEWDQISWKKLTERTVDPLENENIANYPNNTLIVTMPNHGMRRWKIFHRIVTASQARQEQGLLFNLFVPSGDGIAQRLSQYISFKWFPWPVKSLWTIKLLQQLKNDREIPSDAEIYAAWNPNDIKDTPQRLEQKAEAGATGVFTQPPVLRKQFESSIREFRALNDTLPIYVGIPIFNTSDKRGNPLFWMENLLKLDLHQPKNQEAADIVRLFQEKERVLTPQEFDDFRVEWTVKLIKEVREMPGVSGIHLLTFGQNRLMQQVLSRADLVPPETAAIESRRILDDLRRQGITITYEPSLISNDQRSRRFWESLIAFKEAVKQVQDENKGRTLPNFTINWKWVPATNNLQHFHPGIAIVYRKGMHNEIQAFELDADVLQIKSRYQAGQTALFKKRLKQALNGEYVPGVRLDHGFKLHSQSLSWQFNAAFWRHVREFMAGIKGSGADYRQSIGGSPDTNPKVIAYSAEKLWKQLVDAVAHDHSNAPFYYIEAGVASVDHTKLLLTALSELAAGVENGDKILGRLCYVLTDFSSEIIDEARMDMAKEGSTDKFKGVRLFYKQVDAEDPNGFLQEYKGRILRYHATNVFDNLPSDQIARRDGKLYIVKTRLFLPEASLVSIALKYGLDETRFEEGLKKLEATGVPSFLEGYQNRFSGPVFYHFWQDLWNALKLEEEMVPLLNELAFDFLNRGTPGDWNMYLSDLAIRGLSEVRPLLHFHGSIEVIDIFNTEISKTEPVKYDGSEVIKLSLPAIGHFFDGGYKYSPLSSLTGGKPGPRGILEIYASGNRAMAAAVSSHNRSLIFSDSPLYLLGQSYGITFNVPLSARREGFWEYKPEFTEDQRRQLDAHILPAYLGRTNGPHASVKLVFNGDRPVMLLSEGIVWRQVPQPTQAAISAAYSQDMIDQLKQKMLALGYAAFPLETQDDKLLFQRALQWEQQQIPHLVLLSSSGLFSTTLIEGLSQRVISFRGVYPPGRMAGGLTRIYMKPRANATLIYILGSGSGVDTLMAAEKTRGRARIITTDIDLPAVNATKLNVARSPYAGQIHVYQADLFDTVGGGSLTEKADHIYMAIPLPSHEQGNVATHDFGGALFDKLLAQAPTRLKKDGTLEVAYLETPEIIAKILKSGWDIAGIRGTAFSAEHHQMDIDYGLYILVRPTPELRHKENLDLIQEQWEKLAGIDTGLKNSGYKASKEVEEQLKDIEQEAGRFKPFYKELLLKHIFTLRLFVQGRQEMPNVPDERVNESYHQQIEGQESQAMTADEFLSLNPQQQESHARTMSILGLDNLMYDIRDKIKGPKDRRFSVLDMQMAENRLLAELLSVSLHHQDQEKFEVLLDLIRKYPNLPNALERFSNIDWVRFWVEKLEERQKNLKASMESWGESTADQETLAMVEAIDSVLARLEIYMIPRKRAYFMLPHVLGPNRQAVANKEEPYDPFLGGLIRIMDETNDENLAGKLGTFSFKQLDVWAWKIENELGEPPKGLSKESYERRMRFVLTIINKILDARRQSFDVNGLVRSKPSLITLPVIALKDGTQVPVADLLRIMMNISAVANFLIHGSSITDIHAAYNAYNDLINKADNDSFIIPEQSKLILMDKHLVDASGQLQPYVKTIAHLFYYKMSHQSGYLEWTLPFDSIQGNIEVPLKHGGKAPLGNVIHTILELHMLMDPSGGIGLMLYQNLRKAAEDDKPVTQYLEVLKRYQLVQNDGQLYPMTKSVLLSTINTADEQDLLVPLQEDAAQAVDLHFHKGSPKGGIDLNSVNLSLMIKRDVRGIPLPWPKQDLAQLSRISGLLPHIADIEPVTSLPILNELKAIFH